MGSGIVFSSSSSSSSFALSQRVFQPVVKPRPRIQHCHSLCSSFSGVGVSTPSTWNQIQQFSHKSRSSNKLKRKRPVSHTVVVAAGDVPDFLPATWSVKLPPLMPFSSRTSLWTLYESSEDAWIVRGLFLIMWMMIKNLMTERWDLERRTKTRDDKPFGPSFDVSFPKP
jgi:hypothetical protein